MDMLNQQICSKMKAVIIGATGATGKALMQLLMKDETVKTVTTFVRRPLDLVNNKIITEIVNFNAPELWQNLVIGDVAFSCLGTTLKAAGSKAAQYKVDFEYQFSFAKAARENGVKTFVLVSASMANPQSLVFYSRMKGKLETAIQSLGFESLIIFRPGLLSRPGTNRKGEKISESIIKMLNHIGLLRSMKPLPVKDLAQLLLTYGKAAPSGTVILESGKILKEI